MNMSTNGTMREKIYNEATGAIYEAGARVVAYPVGEDEIIIHLSHPDANIPVRVPRMAVKLDPGPVLPHANAARDVLAAVIQGVIYSTVNRDSTNYEVTFSADGLREVTIIHKPTKRVFVVRLHEFTPTQTEEN